MKKIISLMLAAVFVALCFASCSKPEYSEEELLENVKALVEASYELNDIYFGKGLPVQNLSSAGSALYAPVTEDCKYHSTTEIKEATKKVYTTSYCEILFKRGFEGTSDDSSEKVSYARYIDDFDGQLTARKDLEETALNTGRTYDFSTVEIVEMKKSEAKVKIVSIVDEKEDVSVNLTLIKEASGWRLDTPTY